MNISVDDIVFLYGKAKLEVESLTLENEKLRRELSLCAAVAPSEPEVVAEEPEE